MVFTMKKTKSGYRCQNCGYFNTKWLGKCPECGSWNSFSESQFLESTTNNHLTKPSNLKVFTLAEINQQLTLDSAITIYPFQNSQLNHFWGGGIVSGSLSLLAGEPGLGKSTLALQLLRSLFQANPQAGLKLFYVTAEEALTELARRSQRLGIPQEILLFQGNQLEDILQVLQTYQPQVMVIDSIQTIFTNQLVNSPGSVSQVAFLANQFLSISKAQNISFILIGHITKDGQIAGPKTLEHLVDSVLVLEAAKNTNYRTLSFSKHRFGSTEEILLLKMETAGLQIVADPSLALLENLETGVGIVYGIAMTKTYH
jgi:Predicted ATP-dependent serine protease